MHSKLVRWYSNYQTNCVLPCTELEINTCSFGHSSFPRTDVTDIWWHGIGTGPWKNYRNRFFFRWNSSLWAFNGWSEGRVRDEPPSQGNIFRFYAVFGKKNCQKIGWCLPLLGNPGSTTGVTWGNLHAQKTRGSTAAQDWWPFGFVTWNTGVPKWQFVPRVATYQVGVWTTRDNGYLLMSVAEKLNKHISSYPGAPHSEKGNALFLSQCLTCLLHPIHQLKNILK